MLFFIIFKELLELYTVQYYRYETLLLLTVSSVDDGVYGDVLHDAAVAQLAGALLLQEHPLLPPQLAGAHLPVGLPRPADEAPQHVRHQADHLPIAVGSLRVGEGGEGGGGVEAGALRLHLGRLAALRLRELRGDDHEAQVDHEERSDLDERGRRRDGYALVGCQKQGTDSVQRPAARQRWKETSSY